MNSSGLEKTLVAIKASSRSKDIEERAAAERRRDCLVLIHSYLTKSGFLEAASTLERQSKSILSRFEKADNIDLPQILSEYESLYEIKTGRKPKYSRKTVGGESEVCTNNIKANTNQGISKQRKIKPSSSPSHRCRFPESNIRTTLTKEQSISPDELFVKSQSLTASGDSSETYGSNDKRPLKPLPQFEDPDMRNLALSIQHEILETSPNVKWEDIIGLDHAKQLLQEAIVMPLKFPDLFQGPLLQPWQGLLLFGQPGTGKTLLAKAVATETDTTFFNISASSITSKFRGDSEKLIKILFHLARYHAPSTIFFDEIDAIMGHRSSSQHSSGCERMEHEGSRRMKTELLVEMDGLGKEGENRNVFVLCATNLPWDIDAALLRRLDKKILVPPPNIDARAAMIENYFSKHYHSLNTEDFQEISKLTEGYTGSDIKLLCKEAAMGPVRMILKKLETTSFVGSNANRNLDIQSSGNADVQGLLKSYPITKEHVMNSLKCTKRSSCPKLSTQYETWSNHFGTS